MRGGKELGMRTRNWIAAGAIIAANMAYAADDSKPNFSGTWLLDLSSSTLEIAPPDSSTFVITHDDPHWTLERTHVYRGRPNRLVMELTTDGSPSSRSSGRSETVSTLVWEGDALVLHWTGYVRGKPRSNGEVRYSLAASGSNFVAEETMTDSGGTHTNRWVFSRGDLP
jgi:hypothetical protein